jgi:hypothetical protein
MRSVMEAGVEGAAAGAFARGAKSGWELKEARPHGRDRRAMRHAPTPIKGFASKRSICCRVGTDAGFVSLFFVLTPPGGPGPQKMMREKRREGERERGGRELRTLG